MIFFGIFFLFEHEKIIYHFFLFNSRLLFFFCFFGADLSLIGVDRIPETNGEKKKLVSFFVFPDELKVQFLGLKAGKNCQFKFKSFKFRFDVIN